MATSRKTPRLASSTSVSGEGNAYEARVQARYLAAFLMGEPTRFGPRTRLVELRFQAQLDFNTDDLVCVVERDDGSRFFGVMQAKLTLRASASDKPFRKAIKGAWLDYKSNTKFRGGLDRLVIVYGRDASADSVYAATQLCDRARGQPFWERFFEAVEAPGLMSPAQRSVVEAVKTVLLDELQITAAKEDLHGLLRHLWFYEHKVALDEEVEVVELLTKLDWVLGPSLLGGPASVWSVLITTCQQLNKNFAVVTLDTINGHLDSALLGQAFANHRASRTGSQAVVLPLVTVSVTAPAAGVAAAPSLARAGSPVIDVGWADSGRPEAPNPYATPQLDAINGLLKGFKFKDALAQLSVLGHDMAGLTSQQKALWYLYRGTCYWHLEKTTEAAADFLKAYELDLGNDRTAAARVRGLLLSGRLTDALEAGKEAGERFPESLAVWAANANAQILSGKVPAESSLPVSHRNSADGLQLVAAGLRTTGLVKEAAELSLRSLQADTPGFYVRSAALHHVLELVTANKVHTTLKALGEDAKMMLRTVTQAFEPRAEKVWSVQTEGALGAVAANLGVAYLLQGDNDSALQVAHEARQHQRTEPALLRVELDALRETGRVQEMFRLGLAELASLEEGGLVALAQAAVDFSDAAAATAVLEHARGRSDVEVAAKEALQAARWVAMWNVKERAEVLAEIVALDIGSTSSIPLLTAIARLTHKQNTERSQDAVERLQALLVNKPSAEIALMVGDLYLDLQDYKQAAKYYDSAPLPPALSELHTRLLFSLVRSGMKRRAKTLIESLPDGWVAHDELRTLAVQVAQEAGDWTLLTRLADAQFTAHRGEVSSWLFKYVTSAQTLAAADLRALIAQAPLELQGTPQQASQLAVLEMRLGLHEAAMRRLYRMRRLVPSKVESATALMMAVLAYNQPLPHMEEALPLVGPGTHVVLQDAEKVVHLTLDPEGLDGLPDEPEFKPTNWALNSRFIGKTPGDEVELDATFGSVRLVRVLSVESAYRRQLALAHEQIQTSLEPTPNVWSVRLPHDAEGRPDFSEVHEQLKAQSQQIRDAFETYKDIPITLGGMSKLLGCKSVDTVLGWPTGLDATPLYVADGSAEERERAIAVLEDPTSAYIIDSATLAELVRIGGVDALKECPKVYATTQTRELLLQRLEEQQGKGSEGRLLDDDGQMRFIELTARDRAFAVSQTRAMVEAIKSYCEVIPAYGPETKPELLEQLQQLLSSEEHSVLNAALERGLALVSTDLRLRHLAAEMNVRGVWPQVLLQKAASSGAVTASQYSIAAVRLLVGNRTFVPLMPIDLLTLCQQNTFLLRHGIGRLRAYLSHPNTEFGSTFRMVESFVQLAAVSGVRLGALAELLRHVVEGMMRHNDTVEQVPQALFATITDLVSAKITNPYPQVVSHIEALQEMQRDFLTAAINEGAQWAKEPMRDRPVQLAVYFVGKQPIVTLDRVKDNPDRGSSDGA